MRYLIVLSLLAAGSLLFGAEPPKFRLPNLTSPAPTPMPAPKAGPVKLAADTFYVIDSDVPLLILSSPKGAVTVAAEQGPIRLRGKFVDGTGLVETRTYTGKHVYSIEAGDGAKVCELLIMPVGAATDADVVRVSIQIVEVQCPQPPPGTEPKPPVDPKPPADGSKVYFLIVRPSGAATQEFERVMQNPAWDEHRKAGRLVKDKTLAEAERIYSPPSGTTLPFVVTLRVNEAFTESKVIAGPVALPTTTDGIRDLAKGLK